MSTYDTLLISISELSSDPLPKNMVAAFFDSEGLQRILTFLCNSRAPGNWDPVTLTVVDLLSGKLQFCLTGIGLLPFQGRAGLVYPYHMMSIAQKDFLRQALTERRRYSICNESIVFRHIPGEPERLDPVSVLEALCSRILASNVHSEHRVKVGVCNIILQRVQSVVPISKGVQQQLNSALFGKG